MVTHSTKQAYLFQFPVQSMKTTAFSMYDLKIIIISVIHSQNRLVSISYFDIYTKLEITILESLYKPKHVDVNINNKFCMKRLILDYQKKLSLVKEKSLKIEVEHLIIINNCFYLTQLLRDKKNYVEQESDT